MEVLELECCHLPTPCPSQHTQVTVVTPKAGSVSAVSPVKSPWASFWGLFHCITAPPHFFLVHNFHSSSLLHFTSTTSFLPCLLMREIWSFHSLGQGNILKLLPRKFGPHGCKGTEQGIQRWIWTSWVCKCSLNYLSLKCWWLDHKCCIGLRGRLNINLSSATCSMIFLDPHLCLLLLQANFSLPDNKSSDTVISILYPTVPYFDHLCKDRKKKKKKRNM